MELTDEFKNVLKVIEDENSNVFITGKAGTGKSTLLEYFRNHTSKNIAVLAPTGVAALNVNGQTIHSFFKFGIDITTEKAREVKSEALIQILQNLDAIVIDEISMVRADLIDCINVALQSARKTSDIWGNTKIFFGDLFSYSCNSRKR
jgi:nucleoside-triphosphatase THEP1